ncbi:MAG: hypothetical protein ACD_75C00540G0004 [uncultured bacterium]|nr:MAG: hypothetical protein ACD_75C00540G0004 [uncultured bacterium]
MLSIKEIERRLSAQKYYIQNVLKKDISRGYSLNPEESRAIDKACGKVTNDQRARVELASFKKDKPAKYIGYMSGNTITNWTGKPIARITSKKSHKHRGWISTEKVYFDAVGINGVKYYGMGFGDGIYCRMTARKHQGN